MLFVVGLVQLVAYQYARAAALAAAERGVRVASLAGAGVSECEAAVAEGLAGALGGAVAAGLAYGCVEGSDSISARVSGRVPPWTPAGPELSFTVEAVAAKERAP